MLRRGKPKKKLFPNIYVGDWWTNGLGGSFSRLIIFMITYDYFNYYCLDSDHQHMIFSSLSHLIRFKNIIFFLEKSQNI
jgi:hypothetical protein